MQSNIIIIIIMIIFKKKAKGHVVSTANPINKYGRKNYLKYILSVHHHHHHPLPYSTLRP